MVLIYYFCLQSGAEHEGFKDMVDTTRNVRKRGQTCQVLKSFNPTVLLPGASIYTNYWLAALVSRRKFETDINLPNNCFIIHV